MITLFDIPKDVLKKIITLLSNKDICALKPSCKKINEIVNEQAASTCASLKKSESLMFTNDMGIRAVAHQKDDAFNENRTKEDARKEVLLKLTHLRRQFEQGDIEAGYELGHNLKEGISYMIFDKKTGYFRTKTIGQNLSRALEIFLELKNRSPIFEPDLDKIINAINVKLQSKIDIQRYSNITLIK